MLIEGVIEQLKPVWKDLELGIVFKSSEINLVDGDIGEFESAFLNIFKNAVEAMPMGGSLIIITGKFSGNTYVQITDTGIGMSEETKEKMFEPFFTTKPSSCGERGLGMSSVKNTIQDHGGDIFVDSSPGKGTTIRISFPSKT
ncbi:MAG: HAMP domain-containing sensor histidine kinase [bacterium]